MSITMSIGIVLGGLIFLGLGVLDFIGMVVLWFMMIDVIKLIIKD